MRSYVSCFAPPIQARPALKTAHEAHAAVAFCRISSHFRRIFSHFRRIFSHFRRILSHFRRIFSHFCSFLFHPLPDITAYITCPYARFPVDRLSHFSHFSAELVPPSAGCPPPREKNEERKMKIPLFLVFRFWFFILGFSFACTPHHVPKYT